MLRCESKCLPDQQTSETPLFLSTIDVSVNAVEKNVECMLVAYHVYIGNKYPICLNTGKNIFLVNKLA